MSSFPLPKSVSSIGNAAFYGCKSLTSFYIHENYIVFEYLENTFTGCEKLASIDIHTENELYTSDNGVIYNKSKTKFLYCPEGFDGNVSVLPTVTELPEGAFYNCINLKKITLPSSITKVPYICFENCKSLTEVLFEGNVTSLEGDAFRDCTSLTSFNMPNSIKTVGNNCFRGCTSLESINWSAGVTAIPEDCFSGCTSLKSIVLPEGLQSINDRAFGSCSSLKEITLPSSFRGFSFDPKRSFNDCNALENVFVKSGNPYFSDVEGTLYSTSGSERVLGFIPPSKKTCVIPSDGKFIIPVYYYQPNLNKFEVSSDNSTLCDVDGILYSKDMKNLVACPEGYVFNGDFHIPEGVTTIQTGAFAACMNLGVIHIPSSVTDIMGDAFAHNGLTDIYLYSKNPSSSDSEINGYPGVAPGITEQVTLHVLEGLKDAYLQDPVWNVFSNIVTFSVHEHSFASAWTQTSIHHYHACTGDNCDIADYSILTGTDATSAAYGQHSYGSEITEAGYYTCSVCEYVNSDKKAEYDAAAQLAADQAEADRIAADKKAVEDYKSEQKKTADGLSKAGDTAACQKLITDAKAAIDAVTYDKDKTVAAIKTSIDEIITKLKKDLEAAREANGIDTLFAGLQIKVSGSELCIDGAQGVAVNIYTMGGALVASKLVSEETITVTLPASTYLIKAGNQNCKIQIK